ncbi:TetR/AcrR family transcriptional regulator C-terminal domain-containing protein [Tsukamurella sp. 8F]|uniref:TetR/AcrR family transcriptional regulator n=1 Tax=unclassified Tsukamurella TaxID=2633480 RepID=UPI0023B94A8E|nr:MULTISPECIES: TetR/AcrR family transcriptional regulator C-terminal domain-containing protein [unclassified Tsukamurella]MDF0528804.1 TetR/AcrR family transcriptional regulator C-terminal domain-containing protein [Tsukamurella sp. 8J]MDF0586639.1 TetR/AcrR family transcriptional regulator C-terminal domain-containing protein [Tsukamurella sp. 8F]
MTPRRRSSDALSRDRIVDVAIEILDAEGESALTFRTLARRLSTGPGAIYHHVAGKSELLAAATDTVVGHALEGLADSDPREAIRRLALALFDAIDEHPWVGAHLGHDPWQDAMLEIYEGVGGRLAPLGVPEAAQFFSASALVSYILGVAGQNAANARMRHTAGRNEVLAGAAELWASRDPAAYPFLHRAAEQLRDHDDREQFLAGIDLILDGLG